MIQKTCKRVNLMRTVLIIFTCLVLNSISLHAASLNKSDIKELQFNLNQLGYEAGVPDGLPGKKTNAAIKRFFEFENQAYDGSLSKNEITALKERLERLAKRSVNPAKILPEPAKEKDYPFCAGIKLPTYKDVLDIFDKNKNFTTVSMGNTRFHNDLADVREIITWYHSAYWANPTQSRGDDLKNFLIEILSRDFASELKDKRIGADDNMALKDLLLAMMYAYGSLAQNFQIDQSDLLFFHREFKKRLITASKSYPQRHTMSRCKIGTDTFGCQNHTYQQQHIRTLFGYLFDYPVEFEMGERLYKFAIDDLSEDGALWREASRSRWSWSYYSHALGHLVSIAELNRLSGNPILDYRSNENNYRIHDAVAFLLDAIEQPELMWKYAKTLEGVDHYNNYQDYKSTEYLDRLVGDTEHSGMKNWYYIYRSIAAPHENINRADQFIPTFKKQLEFSKHLGFLGQCVYDTGSSLGETSESFSNFNFRKELPGDFKPHGYEIVKADDGHPVRNGEESIRVEVRAGDCGFEFDGSWSDCDQDRERHELRSQAFRGEKYLYFSVYVPKDFLVLDNFTNTSIAQVYADTQNKPDPNAPSFMFKFYGGEQLKIENSVVLPTVETVSIANLSALKGEWNDFLIYANWTDADDGFAYVFLNSATKPVYSWKGSTLQKGYEAANFKFGVYRSHISRSDFDPLPTQVLYYDTLVLGDECLKNHSKFDCLSIQQLVQLDKSASKTCGGEICKPTYDRTREGLGQRFDCFLEYGSKTNAANLPTRDEISILITNLQENEFYRNKRHLVKLGLSQNTVDQHKKTLLKIVNDTGSVEKFCSRFID